MARFLWLLYRRTFGAESIRRIAFLSRTEVSPEARNSVRRIFFTRPVAIIGTIVPTFSDVGAVGEEALGTVENIAKIVREYRLTDILVVDSTLSYSEVLRAMGVTASQPLRYHIIHGALESSGEVVPGPEVVGAARGVERRGSWHLVKKLRDRVIAFIGLFILPVVYLAVRAPRVGIGKMWEVFVGRRDLVGAGGSTRSDIREPLFAMTALYREGTLSGREIAQLESFYNANQSFLLDCEIIISVLRHRKLSAPVEVIAKKEAAK
jgi:hypothetical protein